MQFLLAYIEFFVFVALLLAGFFVGRAREAAHYRSIEKRERALRGVYVFSNRFPPADSGDDAQLVAGSVVVSEDYFKRVIAGLYGFFGGRLKSYESLLDRARREAVLRMKAAAAGAGRDMIVNVKFQTFSIPGRNGRIGAVEMLAYGTAIRRPRG